ncbi:hypothetical protein PG993_005197 [Apiospora rasikravindrae]|uniref:Cep57 centrosome microtubule-binding domain-containing protein n=1 Tax=Apiospora rasikravindrae TaxID=990691 RepID=A0ABR1TEZ5_9PEZI
MAMQAVTDVSKDRGHGKSGSTGSARSIPYPSMPASPTLTNPEMILPDWDPGNVSSPDRSQSPLMMWKTANGFDMNQFDLGAPAFPSAPITPTTPIIYGNGTMLSDIGEVTENESTVSGPGARRASSVYSLQQPEAMNIVYETLRKKHSGQTIVSRDRDRRYSMESTSTITNGDHHRAFADFDDTVSVDDSVFQGDDEESNAASYAYDEASMTGDETPTAQEFRESFMPTPEDRYSTVLSRRAEQILANAKRRLTTMEGNLNRARTSMSSYGSDSTPSPSFQRPATAVHSTNEPTATKNPRGHSRISSENNVSTAVRPAPMFSPRASSAMGTAGGYRRPLKGSRSAEYMPPEDPFLEEEEEEEESSPKASLYGNQAFAKSKASLHDTKIILEPLDEDETPQDLENVRASIESSKLESFLSPTFGSFNEKGLRRSASTAQMRELKDHMTDLKGRLSALRDQAREDNMKRRSLSSLRTPSPFTHARVEQWYAATKGVTEEADALSEGAASVNGKTTPAQEEVTKARVVSGLSDEDSIYTDLEEPYSPQTKLAPAEIHIQSPSKTGFEFEDDEDLQTEDGYEDEAGDGFVDVVDLDSQSESGESSYHDSVQNQMSHEDREDAFDYEHFFLHSAMGSMTQRRMLQKGNRDSYSSEYSEDSVETARGPLVVTKRGRRRGSDVSVSSTDSFATATEGRLTRADTSAAEEYPEETVPERSRSHSPEPKRLTFGFNTIPGDTTMEQVQQRASVLQRPSTSAAAYKHRPGAASISSTGTTRSFPLVHQSRSNGVLTPGASPRESPDQDLKQISENLMSETASICESVQGGDQEAIGMLPKEDQILVQRLVASLGKCVLGITENGRASCESRLYRRRIDLARKILEGVEPRT